MKILIPNATSPKNIGDLAILTGLLATIKNTKKVKIHSSDPHLHTFKAQPTLYTWAIFENRKPHVRIIRLVQLLIHTSKIKDIIKGYRHPKLQQLLDEYVSADIIIFTGGGYLRSKPGIKQSLNLLMLLLMFYVARNLHAKKVIAPISFGPFAYKWQEKISAKVIRKFDLVSVREKYSYNLLKKYAPSNLLLSTDTSFFLKSKKKTSAHKNFILGFTIRKWLPYLKQKRFEKEFLCALVKFCKETKCVIQPIIQVDAPEYGDFDKKLSTHIANKLKRHGLKVLPLKKVKDLKSAESIYSSIDMLLGMRMHSNILAALVNTPFVAISYEYKTEGISEDLGVSEYCIPVKKVRKEILYNTLKKAYLNRSVLEKKIEISVDKLRKNELNKWINAYSFTD